MNTINFLNDNVVGKRCDFPLVDVQSPNLYRDIFPYTEVPKYSFNEISGVYPPSHEIFITDTTFRDGQQSRSPYTVEQIVTLFKMMSKLGGERGIIRQSEFFIYSERDREALRACQDLGFRFPEITSWVRANQKDLELARDVGIKESGFLVSCSDYHIFKKLKKTRKEAIEDYLSIIRQAIEAGIQPRCHLEDITRADFFGLVLPFALEIRKISEEANIPIKLRLCDTLGYGVSYPGAILPRSIPAIVGGLRNYAGFPPELMEWHGHNDFYKAVSNASAAWLSGVSSVNCTLLGLGERTGNTPTEAMIMEYAQITGTLDGMDPTVIRDIADYYEKELGYTIPKNMPFVGKEFNLTQAGIHADGMLKDVEIYSIFDTVKILKTPPGIGITSTSGSAGITMWLNRYCGSNKYTKDSPDVLNLKEWVDSQYTNGRITTISEDELINVCAGLGIVKEAV